MQSDYDYQERSVSIDPNKQFRYGEGKISGYCSIILGVLSLLAVLAYLFPGYLTTYELRQLYDANSLQKILKYGMYFSLFFGASTFLLGKYRSMGAIGIAATLIAFALGGYSVPIGSVEQRQLTLGVDWLILDFLVSVFVFMALEKIYPKYKNQVILRDECGLDLFYFCLNHLAISAILIYANYEASHFNWAVNATLQETIRSAPLPLQVFVIIICADFVLYWEHRLYHEVQLLWPIHAVHHSIENLDWLAGSRGHFIQVFSERAMVMVSMYLVGASREALDIYVTIAALQAVLIHCNLGLPFGFLKNIIVTPQFHHWHHSSEKPAIDTNYSAHTVLFDRLFKTYHLPGDKWPVKYGTTKPLPTTYIGQTLHPLHELIERFKK